MVAGGRGILAGVRQQLLDDLDGRCVGEAFLGVLERFERGIPGR